MATAVETPELQHQTPCSSPSPGLGQIVQIQGIAPFKQWVPSRFNARTVSDDGSLVLYNSLTGAFSGFPAAARAKIEAMLSRSGTRARLEGLTKYLYERGFVVEQGTDEFSRFRMLYGNMQYRRDTLELILLASEECNFRCVYCYETFPRGVMEEWVRAAIIKMVERRAPTLNVFHVSWFGGEPLLGYEAIKELGPAFVNISKKYDIPFTADMTTNGYLLTPDVFANLLEWRVKGYQITIDGTPEAHDQKRMLKGGEPTFTTIFENLKAIRSLPQQDFDITIRINYDRDNLTSMDSFMETLKGEFGDDKRFQLRFYPIGKWGGPNDDQLQVCGLTQGGEAQALQVQAHKMGLNTESSMKYMQTQTGWGVCYAARPYNLLIGADGKIMKCTIALDTKDYNIIGHMTPDGRADINVDKLARWVIPYYEEDEACRKCFYVPVCQGCSCPLVRIEDNKRPCPGEKVNIGGSLKTLWALKQDTANRYSVAKSELLKHEAVAAPPVKT